MLVKKISLIVSDFSQKGARRWGRDIRPFLLAQGLEKLRHIVQMLGLAYKTKNPTLVELNFPVVSLEFPLYLKWLENCLKYTEVIVGGSPISYIFPHPQEAYQKGQATRKRCLEEYSLSLKAMAVGLKGVIEGL